MITLSIEEVCETASEMLDELAATTPLLHPQDVMSPDPERLLVSVAIDIVGPFTTTLVVRIELESAIKLAASMLGEPFAAIDQATAAETMAEIANVIAGGVKGLVADETHLGIPSSTHEMGPLGGLGNSGLVDHELGCFEIGLISQAS